MKSGITLKIRYVNLSGGGDHGCTRKAARMLVIIGQENKSMEGYQKNQKGSSKASLGATLNERILN